MPQHKLLHILFHLFEEFAQLLLEGRTLYADLTALAQIILGSLVTSAWYQDGRLTLASHSVSSSSFSPNVTLC